MESAQLLEATQEASNDQQVMRESMPEEDPLAVSAAQPMETGEPPSAKALPETPASEPESIAPTATQQEILVEVMPTTQPTGDQNPLEMAPINPEVTPGELPVIEITPGASVEAPPRMVGTVQPTPSATLEPSPTLPPPTATPAAAEYAQPAPATEQPEALAATPVAQVNDTALPSPTQVPPEKPGLRFDLPWLSLFQLSLALLAVLTLLAAYFLNRRTG
jgi:hypothetical protein